MINGFKMISQYFPNNKWRSMLNAEFNKRYFLELETFLESETDCHHVYPPNDFVFNAYKSTDFSKVKVVILGQDPYHGAGQAVGLSFSVPNTLAIPPSLKNVFKELESDYPEFRFQDGSLSSWADQGVFLLNSVLTVRAKSPASHQKKGWETFTDETIRVLSDQKEHLVFLLWGNYARSKKSLINSKKHLVLEAAHPSPFSAYNGFFGCQHFSKTNEYLLANGIDAIDWNLPVSQLSMPGF